MKWLGIMFMAALLVVAPGYGSAQPQKDAPPATQPQGSEVKGEPAGAAKSFTPAERQAYVKKTAEELEAIQQQIAELRVKATTGPAQQKRGLMLAANNLQLQKVAASNRLTALEKAPETAWDQQKAELDKVMEDLRKSCEAAGIKLK
jgi:acyl-CoA reductase-like NAD-dependent aldehyde dehydrogenase